MTANVKPSFVSVLIIVTSCVACEVCPLVEFTVTVNAGRFPPLFTSIAPTAVNFTIPNISIV